MLRMLIIAVTAFLTFSSALARATTYYNDLKFTATAYAPFAPGPDYLPLMPISGEIIYTTGDDWMTPSELLYSNLVINHQVFDQLSIFHGASMLIISQGDTGIIGSNGFYFNVQPGLNYLMFTLANSPQYWVGTDIVTTEMRSTEPIPFPTSAVPEAQTYVMTLLGLALVAGALKRKPKLRRFRRLLTRTAGLVSVSPVGYALA